MSRPLHNQMNCEGCMSIFSRLTWLFRATLITSFMLFHLRKQPRVGGIIRASSLIVRSMIYNRRLKWQSATDSHFSSRLHTSAKAVVPGRKGGFKDADEAPNQVWKAEIRVNALIVHKKGLKKAKERGINAVYCPVPQSWNRWSSVNSLGPGNKSLFDEDHAHWVKREMTSWKRSSRKS